MEIKDILDMLAAGTITKEAANELLNKLRNVTAGKVPKEDKESFENAEEIFPELMKAFDAMKNTPEGQAALRDIMAGRKEERFVKKYTPFINAILSGADVVTSFNQINKSNEAMRQLRRPGMPAIPGVDPALDQSIREAQLGTMDAARAVAPARQAIDDQYNKDLAVARTIGGGQASTVGALAQTAALRRNRAVGSLAPIVDQVRAREQGRLDNLVGARQQQANIDYLQRAKQAELAMNQYNTEMQAAGQLGAMGRLNLRNSAQSLLNQVPRVAARVSGFQDKFDQYEQALNNSLIRRRQEIAGRLQSAMPPISINYQPNLRPILGQQIDNSFPSLY